MSDPPVIRQAAPARESALLVDVLTSAFHDEPLLNWWLRQGKAKDRARRSFFEHAVGGGIHPRSDFWLADDAAAAIWTPPGAVAFDLSPIDTLRVAPRLYAIAGLRGMGRALELAALLAGRHPKAPFAHLVFLGVRADKQGRGLGSALLKRTLSDVDAHHWPAYLETATPENVRLYERFGFEVEAELRCGRDGPQFWTMVRAAR